MHFELLFLPTLVLSMHIFIYVCTYVCIYIYKACLLEVHSQSYGTLRWQSNYSNHVSAL
jgi:hypothetical protein